MKREHSVFALQMHLGIMFAALVLLCAQDQSHAQWPSNPDTPLALGDNAAVVQLNRSMALSPDGGLWVAWIDFYCLGNMRVQRVEPNGSLLVPGGMIVMPDPTCGTDMAPKLAACTDGDAVLCLGAGSFADTPLFRIATDGQMLWQPPIVVEAEAAGQIAGLLAVSNGGVIAGLHMGSSIGAAGFDASGAQLWLSAVATISGPNKRMLAVISDGADGAIVVWDEPMSYKRRIFVARFTADGQIPWGAPVAVVPAEPGSSLHTLPAVIADGSGGTIVVWTFPHEQTDIPSELLMQRVTAGGALAFDPQGLRISLQMTRQYEPLLARDAATGDIFIAWRDGAFDAQSLRVQRMTQTGTRVWGDSGVHVTPIAIGYLSNYDIAWNGNTVLLPVGDTPVDASEPRVKVHLVDGAGVVAAEPGIVSDASPIRTVRALLFDDNDALAVSWIDDQPNIADDELVAQRLNSDGTLGLPTVPADITGDGIVNVGDLLAVINGWGSCAAPPVTCPADIAPPPDGDGMVNVIDLLMVISNFN